MERRKINQCRRDVPRNGTRGESWAPKWCELHGGRVLPVAMHRHRMIALVIHNLKTAPQCRKGNIQRASILQQRQIAIPESLYESILDKLLAVNPPIPPKHWIAALCQVPFSREEHVRTCSCDFGSIASIWLPSRNHRENQTDKPESERAGMICSNREEPRV